MSNWQTYTVEQCCDILDNQRIPLNGEQREKMQGDVPYYGANGVQGYINSFIFDEDLILIAEDGGNFEQFATRPIAYRVSGKSWVNNHAHVLRAKTHFDQDAIFYLLVHKNILSFIVGGTRSKLNQSELRSITLTLPSQKEQSKIAEVLTAVDHTIAQTEALIAKYQRMKRGLMQDLLTRGIDEDGRLRDPATHEFKEVAGYGRVPIEWNIRLLNEVADVRSGVTLGRKLEGHNLVELPYLRVANVQDGYLDLSDVKTVKVYQHEIEKYMLQSGDVLMNEGGDYDKLGRGAVWYGQITPCLHQNHVFRVRTNKSVLLPEYLALVSESPYGKQFFVLNSKQSTNLASINSTQLKAFPIPCPNLSEQQRITDAIAICDNQIKREQVYLQKLQRVKTGLMQDLLTGKVSVAPLLGSDQ